MQERKQPESLRLREVTATFTVSDIEKSLAWYRDVVGFAVLETYKNDEGYLDGVVLVAGQVKLFLGQDDFVKGKNREKGQGFRLFCVTHQDIDELAAAIKSRGGELTQEPENRPWGARDFALVDPDGFALSITSPHPD